jgi:transcription initiation factor TFIIIB Brf1 subunit/transcription initiation factor TFIIB
MEIGECTLNTFIGIRNKKNKGKKLEKHEEEIYKNNKQAIDIKPKVETEVQDVMAEIRALIGKR